MTTKKKTNKLNPDEEEVHIHINEKLINDVISDVQDMYDERSYVAAIHDDQEHAEFDVNFAAGLAYSISMILINQGMSMEDYLRFCHQNYETALLDYSDEFNDDKEAELLMTTKNSKGNKYGTN